MSEAERITRALGGEWRGNSGLAPCPVCQPEGRRDQRALAISQSGGRLLVHCHKSACASVLQELKARNLADQVGGVVKKVPASELAQQRASDRRKEAMRLKTAQDLFASAVSCEGTLAETYFEARGIHRLRFGKMTNTLRFHPATLHSPTNQNLPALIAQIRGPNGEALGVHRTYLRADGTGKADVAPAKMMIGPSAGGAVRFGPDNRVIAVAEGIETALSVSLASRLTVWACLSTSGLKGLRLPRLPAAEVVVIAADHDEAGLAAAAVAAGNFEMEGRAVSVIHPPKPGTDFNDILRGAV